MGSHRELSREVTWGPTGSRRELVASRPDLVHSRPPAVQAAEKRPDSTWGGCCPAAPGQHIPLKGCLSSWAVWAELQHWGLQHREARWIWLSDMVPAEVWMIVWAKGSEVGCGNVRLFTYRHSWVGCVALFFLVHGLKIPVIGEGRSVAGWPVCPSVHAHCAFQVDLQERALQISLNPESCWSACSIYLIFFIHSSINGHLGCFRKDKFLEQILCSRWGFP